MSWSKPEFVEISLSMEVTAYVNTDESVVGGPLSVAAEQGVAASSTTERGPRATEK